MTVDIKRSPYFDDYDESKGFHKILHVPRRPVQVRELNQVQSIFQKQVQRLGDHFFDEGSMVIPGELNFDLDYSYVKVSISNLNNVSSLLVKGISIESSGGVTAELVQFVAPEDSDPATFYIKYINADGVNTKFVDSESLSVYNTTNDLISTATVIEEGIGSKITVNAGVYYFNGKFILNETQTNLLSKYDNAPSTTSGFLYKETIVNETDDSSLNDNAQGTFNLSAPGAHRLKVDLELVTYPLSELNSTPSNYFEVFRIKDGLLQKKARGPEYNILNDVLAQRTYEESGDYSVKTFKIGLREHLLTNGNRGLYNAGEGGDDTKFVVQVESGIAYVKGYRVENFSTLNIEANKARTTGVINNSSFSASLGYYILIDNLNRLPNTTDMTKVSFYDGSIGVPGGVPSGSIVGTARIRFIQREGAKYKLYLFDAKNDSGYRDTSFLSSATVVYHTNFTADLDDNHLYDSSNNSLVYPLNINYVKSLQDGLGQSDTSFTTVRQFSGTTDTSGDIVFSTIGNEVFVSQSETNSFVSYVDVDNEFDEVVGNFVLGGVPTGSTITLGLGLSNASRPILVNLQTVKESVSQKVKTSTITSKTGSLNTGNMSLEKADAYRLNSVLDDNGLDVTDSFELVCNKTRSFYCVSYISKKDGTPAVAEPVTVNFTYFAHSSGDYFGVNSYDNIDYNDIPIDDGVRLSDVLDFRPRIANDGQDFTGSGSSLGNIPTPYSIVRSDVEHYLPRVDKLYVDFKGNFGIVSGSPSLRPKEPSDVSGTMTLYTLYVPPYTFSVGDVNAAKRNNKRYTMKDIGNLENRISSVEYYVSLSFLEQEALSRQIIDPDTGLNRFKNGIMVDPFVDLKYSDISWNGFGGSVTPIDGGSLRPSFLLNSVDLQQNVNDTVDVVVNNGIATLPFTETLFIGQGLASTTINVNPYAVYRWSGDISLSPTNDTWFDNIFTEPEIIFETVQMGTVTTNLFDGWQLNWSGIENSIEFDSSGNFNSFGASSTALQSEFGTSSDIVTGSVITQNTSTTQNNDFVGDRVIGTSIIPFMRSIDVEVTGVGNRPNATMNFFFDNINVNDYMTPNGGSISDPVMTDATGNFSATFTIPNDDAIRFRTGERQLTVTDDANNDRVMATSYGQATFSAQGAIQTIQQTIVSTRVETTTIDVNWVDPIAQSFLVESEGGAFVTKVDLYFSSKDDNLPVSVDIREMENGYPTQRIVPGSKRTLNPAAVNTSVDGSVETTFEFKYPIYLNDNTEYCFVVTSNSDLYNVFIASMGENDIIGEKAIAKQPYAGVMFKSQNSSTWTADQNSDLKFELYKARFSTNTNSVLALENKELSVDRVLGTNPFTTTNGSSEVTFTLKNNNMFVSASVNVSDASGGNGLLSSDINGDRQVISVSGDDVTISVGDTATSDGGIGGSAAKVSDRFQASLLMPNVFDIKFPGTSINYQAKGISGKSLDGDEFPYQSFPTWIDVQNKENYDLNQPWLVTTTEDESVNLSGEKSFKFRALISSSNENISPVIDLDSCGVITPHYIVNSENALELDGSNNLANNRTLPITLKQPAESLRIYLNVSRPATSDIIISARFGNSIEELQSSSWTEIKPVVSLATSNRGVFIEQEFNEENINPYTVFQVMIQLKSESSAFVPIVKKLRCIALGT